MHYKINYHFTNKCDMSCHYCYGMMNESLNNDVLKTFNALTKLTNAINFAGGEVFLDIDTLHEMVQLGLKKSIQMSIISNGYQLLKHLDDPKIYFILKHIDKLGISVDSFNETTNGSIGRKTLDLKSLIKVSNLCRQYRTKLKINTVVSKLNHYEHIVDAIEQISPDVWKIIEVYSDKDEIKLTIDEYDAFVQKNTSSNLNISCERSANLTKSYVMVNGNGNLFIDQTIIDSVNVNDLLTEEQTNISIQFETALKSNGFDENAYFERYKTSEHSISIDGKSFKKKLNKRYHDNENMLLIDVEGINPRIYETKKYPFLTLGFKPVLYTGLIVNRNFEIIKDISSYLDPKKNVIREMFRNNKKVLEPFYTNIVRTLIENKIGLIVVSGIESELTFFEEMLYYGNMNRIEFEYVKTLMNNMLDIQSIKKDKILHMDTSKFASRSILQTLNEYRSDLFPFTRFNEKDGASSRHVSIDLLSLYLLSNKYTESQLAAEIDYNLKYCLDDVYDDYKLLYAYSSMSNIVSSNVDKNTDRSE